jgi:hypothetical protein
MAARRHKKQKNKISGLVILDQFECAFCLLTLYGTGNNSSDEVPLQR